MHAEILPKLCGDCGISGTPRAFNDSHSSVWTTVATVSPALDHPGNVHVVPVVEAGKARILNDLRREATLNVPHNDFDKSRAVLRYVEFFSHTNKLRRPRRRRPGSLRKQLCTSITKAPSTDGFHRTLDILRSVW